VRERYTGLVTMHWPVPSIYDDPLLLIDLSKFVRTFFRAGTANVGGTVIGTDKVIHFINVGRLYHAKYEELLAQGLNAEQAAPAAIAATSANSFYSEDGFLGIFTTGIHSNADMAGFKFYRNLSEPVRIGNRKRPAMLVRDSPFWRVQMRAGEHRFTAFVTPHWSEVLNPNRYLDFVALAWARWCSSAATRCSTCTAIGTAANGTAQPSKRSSRSSRPTSAKPTAMRSTPRGTSRWRACASRLMARRPRLPLRTWPKWPTLPMHWAARRCGGLPTTATSMR